MGRLIKRMLVANRGEIAVRVFSSARELGIHTVAIYTSDDINHAFHADEAVLLDSPADFTDAALLLRICVETKADSLHPAYGFLSENADLAESLNTANITFIGPSSGILRQVSEKTTARRLAKESNIPILPALPDAITNLDDAAEFIEAAGFPLMIKAVDGGGGRGIRLVRGPAELEQGFARACGESPSGRVFLEKAAVDGFRHVEVQILGDEYGNVHHLWERECSIQRRFQKVVELCPSTIKDRILIEQVIKSALRMAQAINYSSLGTFEFLVHESRSEFYFLEVNPRLQVEHTVTEQVAGVDIVHLQLLLIQGASIKELHLPSDGFDLHQVPSMFAIQVRVVAEDAKNGFILGMGKVTHFQSPGGLGVRVDTHLSGARPTVIGSSYDSLLAKIIVSSSSFEGARRKALRALEDTVINGVKTNINVLLGILSSRAFQHQDCDTRWLEAELPSIIESGETLVDSRMNSKTSKLKSGTIDSTIGISNIGSATHLFKKGDGYRLVLHDLSEMAESKPEEHLLVWDRIIENNFPTLVRGDLTLKSASSVSASKKYAATLAVSKTNTLASSSHRIGDLNNRNHVVLPFPGQFVELLVDIGDEVGKDDIICVVKQMKMELEIRSPISGVVLWVCDIDDGETVNEGTLVCELEPSTKDKVSSVPSRL